MSHDGPNDGVDQFSDDLRFYNLSSSHVEVELAAQSHQGFVRSANEDHYHVVRLSRSLETVVSNITEKVPKLARETAYGMIVADGISENAAGEVASRVAVQTRLELAL
ncbi:MAG TPA: hypothetical protein VI306_03835, partial [Pyrinomonadaceae bacterium]